MSDEQPAESEAVEGPWSRESLAWVSTVDVSFFNDTLKGMREGTAGAAPMPAMSMFAMREFAISRPVGELVAFAACFKNSDDTFQAIATAALRRTPQEAAELVIEQLKTDRGTAGGEARDDGDGTATLVRNVVHDVAGQRPALDIAEFLQACKNSGRHGSADTEAQQVVDWTIQRFTSPDSGRTQLDRARLYVALLFLGCPAEADAVMRETLRHFDLKANGGLPDDADAVEFAQALRTISPSESLLADWVAHQLNRHEDFEFLRRIIAGVLHSDQAGEGRKGEIVEYVSERLESDDIIAICRLLTSNGSDACSELRRCAASIEDPHKLAGLVKRWYDAPLLKGSTQLFLADIAARGNKPDRGPRSLTELVLVDSHLDRTSVTDECRQQLWEVAAVHVKGRSGDEMVQLLRRITHPRRRRSAEQKIAAILADEMLRRSVEPEQFAQYIQALRDTHDIDPRTAVFLACKQLADPDDAQWHRGESAGVIARTAARLNEAGLVGDAADLLERCMEDEQRMTPEDMRVIVRCLTEHGFPGTELENLLTNTLGRWSDAGHRGAAVTALQGPDFHGRVADFVSLLR
ncbi:hypothetical protein POF50_031260 [Streptomyces sp. SL13]|uniref:Uncharacterized protein n=1 Tax=Streptantibioticus silvisoli TaxID=2705255 RepID=A0AA90KBT8_9ACTN|nr:hypothetical protein [Streptantibioticus silvisoli]MDI5973767.1 hypothetical protein [Streptantibioticus silvisoli]